MLPHPHLRASGASPAPHAPAASGPERRLGGYPAVLILDARGAVQFCSDAAAQLFDDRTDEMLGRPVTELIPALPLRTVTPGYNLAYARFWAAQHVWRRFRRSAHDQQSRALELMLKTAQRQQDVPYGLILKLRGASE